MPVKKRLPRKFGRRFSVWGMKNMDKQSNSVFHKYSYCWVTLALFIFSLAGHWLFGWYSYVDEQESQHASIEVSGYLHLMMRDTLENWQSEFLQLIWQVAGLAYFLYVGSPQSKEGDDRLEAKIDAIILKLDQNAEKTIRMIDDQYLGRETDPFYKTPKGD